MRLITSQDTSGVHTVQRNREQYPAKGALDRWVEEYKQRAKPQKIQKAESTEKKLNTKKRTKNKKTNPERVKSQANSGKVANAPKAKGDTPEARALRLLQHLSKKKSKDG